MRNAYKIAISGIRLTQWMEIIALELQCLGQLPRRNEKSHLCKQFAHATWDRDSQIFKLKNGQHVYVGPDFAAKIMSGVEHITGEISSSEATTQMGKLGFGVKDYAS